MEVINSFFSNIKDKLTNPFFGTLIIVLLIHHWQLWYAVFNFDNDCTLNDKIVFIRNYATVNLTFWKILSDVLHAILLMLLGYLIIIATRSLVLYIEFGLMPSITGRIVNKDVVRRSEYDDVVKEREQYFDQYEEQRKNVRLFSKTIDEQTEQIKLKDNDLLKQSEIISNSIKDLDYTKKKLTTEQDDKIKLSDQIKHLNNSLDQLQKDYDVKTKQVQIFDDFFDGENTSFYYSPEKFPPTIINKVRELKSEGKWLTFLSLVRFFHNGGSIGGEALSEMIDKGIAFERGSRQDLTPLGEIIWRYHDIFEEYN
ncbi:hypothetical protein HNP37_002508 [Flavobacterium nitrogenifigens]|uniref:Uncharacterized protein n=2 Tax=Flavobacterium TaxID=237 RepID=A0A7W7IXV0_9FLAO|nr:MULTISPECIES: hypothetical protein [Flavobacterium]MBB4802435.1 hypothetical protein [Flavobacterium nitrogenifigens]MBB6387393.1 hypothetical protein [Flavobacterium notoginsengisoli]